MENRSSLKIMFLSILKCVPFYHDSHHLLTLVFVAHFLKKSLTDILDILNVGEILRHDKLSLKLVETTFSRALPKL